MTFLIRTSGWHSSRVPTVLTRSLLPVDGFWRLYKPWESGCNLLFRTSGPGDGGRVNPWGTKLYIPHASCLISWLAIFHQPAPISGPACSRQLTAGSLYMFLFWRAAWHCIMAQQICALTSYLFVIHVLCSPMVPGNLPSQLETLSTGQTYFENQAVLYICMPHDACCD